MQLRYHASEVKALARQPVRLKFDFFGGGSVILFRQFIDAIRARLLQTKATAADRDAAMATVLLIVRYLGWRSYNCDRTVADLAEMRSVLKSHMAETLTLLERVSAITRTKPGRTKIITINPEGAFRGDGNRHAEAVDRYRAEVVQFRPEAAA